MYEFKNEVIERVDNCSAAEGQTELTSVTLSFALT